MSSRATDISSTLNPDAPMDLSRILTTNTCKTLYPRPHNPKLHMDFQRILLSVSPEPELSSSVATHSGDERSPLSSPVTEATEVSAKVPEALEKVFHCEAGEGTPCNTGQEYSTAEKACRPVVSNYFGRNKNQSKSVPHVIWCRKHYQRASAEAKSQGGDTMQAWQYRKLIIILAVFDRLEEEHPGMTYDVQLVACEERRLEKYFRFQLGKGPDPRIEEKTDPPPTGRGYPNFRPPFEALVTLHDYMGENKTRDQCVEILRVMWALIENNQSEQLPVVEFLKRCGNAGKKAKPTCRKCVEAAAAASTSTDVAAPPAPAFTPINAPAPIPAPAPAAARGKRKASVASTVTDVSTGNPPKRARAQKKTADPRDAPVPAAAPAKPARKRVARAPGKRAATQFASLT